MCRQKFNLVKQKFTFFIWVNENILTNVMFIAQIHALHYYETNSFQPEDFNWFLYLKVRIDVPYVVLFIFQKTFTINTAGFSLWMISNITFLISGDGYNKMLLPTPI